MRTEFFIAKRFFTYRSQQTVGFHSIISIAVFSVSLSLAVMLLSVAIVTGFKEQIRNKIVGFGSHITLTNYDLNVSYETAPVDKNQPFIKEIQKIQGIKHIQIFATKAGIIKTKNVMQGVVLKGIDQHFNWDFFKMHLAEGEILTLNDSITSKNILISRSLANLLQLKLLDSLKIYFIQNPPRIRKFKISGIFNTGMEEHDKLFAFVDISHIRKLNNWTNSQVSGFEILINHFENLDPITQEVYEAAGYTFTAENSKFKIATIKENFPQLFDWLSLIDTNVWVILGLMTLVAGINIISGYLILILERTKSIGIFKTLGFSNRKIKNIFLSYAFFLVIKSLFWGNVIGIGICLIQKFTGIITLDAATYYVNVVPIELNFWYCLFLNLGTLIATLTFLVLPSIMISKISPIKALQFQ